MSGQISRVLGVLSVLLVGALCFVAFGIFLLLAGWNNWFPFDGEDQPDKTVVSFPEDGEVQSVSFSESDFAIPGLLTVWKTVKVSCDSNPEFQLLSQVTIQDVEKLGFVRAELEGPANSHYYRLLNSQFHFVDGVVKSCRIDCGSFKSVRFQLTEGSKIFSLPISESEFSRLLADARKRNRTKK